MGRMLDFFKTYSRKAFNIIGNYNPINDLPKRNYGYIKNRYGKPFRCGRPKMTKNRLAQIENDHKYHVYKYE